MDAPFDGACRSSPLAQGLQGNYALNRSGEWRIRKGERGNMAGGGSTAPGRWTLPLMGRADRLLWHRDCKEIAH
eukprot:gene21494-biopygen20667